jgi:hypothetical protein
MSQSHGKQIKKITALAVSIRRHPKRSPFGPAEAVQIRSRRICGREVYLFLYKRQALLDEAAGLACMAYVDHSLRINRPSARQNGCHARGF